MPRRRWRSNMPAESRAILFVSEFKLRSFRDVPRMFRCSSAVFRQIKHSDGAFRCDLRAQILRKTFHTRSLWRDAAAIQAFVHTEPHTSAMRALHPTYTTAAFAQTPLATLTDYPTWSGVVAMLASPNAHRIDAPV